MTTGEIFAEIMSNPNLRGVTFSGGEPFEQPAPLAALGRMCKDTGLTLMSYSGYTLEELKAKDDPDTDELLDLLDILVDGRYEQDLRDLTLLYRGSSNQRVIDMNRTRAEGKIAAYRSEFDI